MFRRKVELKCQDDNDANTPSIHENSWTQNLLSLAALNFFTCGTPGVLLAKRLQNVGTKSCLLVIPAKVISCLLSSFFLFS